MFTRELRRIVEAILRDEQSILTVSSLLTGQYGLYDVCLSLPCIVGVNGELEHSSAMLHPKAGKPIRAAIGGGKSIIPSNEKVAGVGASLDISLHFKDAAFVRTHYGSCEIRVPDAPRADEIIMAVVLADAGRPHALVNGQGRIGGLQKWEAKCEDGNR